MRLRGSGPRRLTSSLFGLLALLAVRGVLAAPPPYVVDVWQAEDGLPINGAFAVAQGRDGYLWVATQEGLARFDGARFRVFDKGNTPAITHNDMRTLLAARDGSLWIGSDGGGLLHLKDGRFAAYSARDGLGHDSISSLYEDERGVLWIGTNGGGLARFEEGRFARYTARDGLTSDAVRALCGDGRGGLWIGMRGGLTRFTEGRFTSYTTRDGLPNDFVRALSLDREGTLWVGTNGGGLARFRDGRFTTLTSRQGLPNDSVLAIREDRLGALWVGTNGGGLGRLQDGVWATFTARDGLGGDLVWSIEEDREGSLWLGVSDGGLTRLKAATFRTYGTREGLSDETVLPVFQDRLGRLWVGTAGGGLHRLEAGRFARQPTPSGVAGRPLLALADDRSGSLWVGGAGSGLHRLRDGAWTSFTAKDGLSSNLVSAIHEDRRGVLWVGTAGGGLNRMSAGRFTTVTAKDGLANDVVWFIEEDRAGGLWVGTEGGLSHLADGGFTNYTKQNGLCSDRVAAFYEDEARAVWIGTAGGGLCRLKDGKWVAITTRQGLFDDVVLRILPDAHGGLWMSCNKGIFRAIKRDLDDVADGTLRSLTCVAYGRADGMRNRECNGGIHPAGWRSSDGRLWFPTMKGVVVTDPAALRPNTLPPPVVIEEILADGRPLAPGSDLRLPAGTGHIELHYTGLSLLASDKVRFRYRLEGFDRQWVEAGPRRTAFYTNLAPGRYRFRVTAANNDGVWNSQGASLDLAIEPRFYQTTWFFGLCALALAGAGLGAHRLRLRQVRERELVRLVDERTRDLLAEKQRAEVARDELARSEAKYRGIFENAVEGIYQTSLDGRYVTANPTLARIYGYESPEDLMAAVADLNRQFHVQPGRREEFIHLVEERGAVRGFESQVYRKDGSVIWISEDARAIRDASGKLVGFEGTTVDVTERRRAEDALRASEERLRLQGEVLEAAFDAVVITDREGKIQWVNPAFTRLTGYPPEEVTGRTPRILQSGLHDRSFYEALWRTILSGRPWEGEINNRRKDGTLYTEEMTITPVQGEGGAIAHFVAIKRDITARKLAEEARARLAAILEATTDFVAIGEPGGRVLYVNKAGRKLLGVGPDEDLSRVRPADGHPEWVRKLMLEVAIPAAIRDGVWKGETAFLDGEGREVPFSQIVLAHKSPEGAVAFISTVARDLSEQKSLEAQLRQAQKMEAIGQLAGGVAHDFNNLLGVIEGYGDLLLRDIGPQHPGRGRVGEILKAADRAAALTRQLLAFSRKQVLQPRLLDLNAVLANIEKMLRRLIGEHIQLVTVFKDGLWRTMADPGQMEQVIVNLAVNARDAMPGGGKLILETANVELDEVYAHSHAGARPGPHVMLAVSDTGHGMDSETLTHMFEPFFTTKEQGKGTGLGLATVYGIVRQSGGHVNVYSEPGRGSTFKVYLPRAEGEAEVVAPTPAPAAATAGGSETILLAEDEEALRVMIREILEAAGYTVLGGARPDEVLTVARSHTGAIHLLLTDVVMPGMSGRELATQVQAAHPGVRVLFMSGYTNEAINHHDVLKAGVAFIQKPFTHDSLLHKVREVLDAPRESH